MFVLLHVPESVTDGKRREGGFGPVCMHTHRDSPWYVQGLPKVNLRKAYFPSVVIKG